LIAPKSNGLFNQLYISLGPLMLTPSSRISPNQCPKANRDQSRLNNNNNNLLRPEVVSSMMMSSVLTKNGPYEARLSSIKTENKILC
jgi:hypothetical protein